MHYYGITPVRDRKDQGEDSIKQACSCWCWLAIVDKPQVARIYIIILRAFFVLIADAI